MIDLVLRQAEVDDIEKAYRSATEGFGDINAPTYVLNCIKQLLCQSLFPARFVKVFKVQSHQIRPVH